MAAGTALLVGAALFGGASVYNTVQQNKHNKQQQKRLDKQQQEAKEAARQAAAVDNSVGESDAAIKLGRSDEASTGASALDKTKPTGTSNRKGGVKKRVGGLGANAGASVL